MNNFRREFDLFYSLDEAYKAPLSRLDPSPDEALIPQLFFFVHYHLFIAVSSCMRVHLSDAMGSVRKGIDGALTAYELILYPEKSKDYLNRSPHFKLIKRNITNSRKGNLKSYPLAAELLDLHEQCSAFGSHADISTFAHRTRIISNNPNSKLIKFDYFQKPSNGDEFRYYFLCILHAFYLMFIIFRLYFDKELRIVDVAWEGRIKELGKLIPASRRQAYEASERSR